MRVGKLVILGHKARQIRGDELFLFLFLLLFLGYILVGKGSSQLQLTRIRDG